MRAKYNEPLLGEMALWPSPLFHLMLNVTVRRCPNNTTEIAMILTERMPVEAYTSCCLKQHMSTKAVLTVGGVGRTLGLALTFTSISPYCPCRCTSRNKNDTIRSSSDTLTQGDTVECDGSGLHYIPDWYNALPQMHRFSGDPAEKM